MSGSELDRLLNDVRKSDHLLGELRSRLQDPASALRWASERGYTLRLEDVDELRESGEELSEEDLEQVAGGEDAWGSGSGTGSGGG